MLKYILKGKRIINYNEHNTLDPFLSMIFIIKFDWSRINLFLKIKILFMIRLIAFFKVKLGIKLRSKVEEMNKDA